MGAVMQALSRYPVMSQVTVVVERLKVSCRDGRSGAMNDCRMEKQTVAMIAAARTNAARGARSEEDIPSIVRLFRAHQEPPVTQSDPDGAEN